MNRWIGITVLLANTVFLCLPSAAQKFSVTAQSVVTRPGETFTLRLNMAGAPGGDSLIRVPLAVPPGITFAYPSIDLIPYPQGIFAGNGGALLLATPDPQIKIVAALDAPNERGASSGPLVDLYLHIEDVAPGPQYLFLGVGSLETKQNGTFYSRPVSVPLVVTGKQSCPGDVDGDGRVTVSDALWILRLSMKVATASPGVFKTADLWPQEGDGRINIQDAVTALRFLTSIQMAVNPGSCLH